MWTWAQIILAVLKFLNWAIQYGQEQRWLREGEQRQIAKQLLEVTRKHEIAKQTLNEIATVPDAQLDDILRKLEPSDG